MWHRLFKDLSFPERVMYVILALTVVSITLWWRLGIVAVITFSVLSLVNIFYTGFFINRSLARSQKICLWLMIAYSLLYIVSAIVSVNHAEGFFRAIVKSYFLILPLLCLLCNTSYLTRTHIRALFQIFTATLLVRFVICLIISVFQLLQGTPFVEVRDWQEDPLGMHHNYLALYIVTSIAYLYTSMVQFSCGKNKWPLWSMLGAVVVLTVYLFIISSRSGIVTLAILLVTRLIHLAFVRKKYKTALAVLTLSGALVGGLLLSMPAITARFAALHQNRVADDRVLIWQCGMKTAQERLLFGYGSGDCMTHLMAKYEEQGYTKAITNNFNAHNQYIETLLETGIVGETILLLMLLAPALMALRKGRRDLLSVLVIEVILIQNIFETMLNRQMGVQFIALVYCLLILAQTPPEFTAFCRPSQSDAS